MKIHEMGFGEIKKIANEIIGLLAQSDKEILTDLIEKTENDPMNISWLRIYLQNCLDKLGL